MQRFCEASSTDSGGVARLRDSRGKRSDLHPWPIVHGFDNCQSTRFVSACIALAAVAEERRSEGSRHA